MIIRLENEKDYLEVENLVRDSFWNIYRPGAYEHYIVHHLRNDSSFIKDLAFVMEIDNRIIGHINHSIGEIEFDDGRCENALILGQVSIDESYQKGYGSKLIEYSLKIAENKKYPFVFVICDENYYHRFGFESASEYNLHLNGTDTNGECPFFMIKIFDEEKISNEKGIFKNPKVFDVDESDVNKFDKKFEIKEKKVIEGQLNL